MVYVTPTQTPIAYNPALQIKITRIPNPRLGGVLTTGCCTGAPLMIITLALTLATSNTDYATEDHLPEMALATVEMGGD